MASTGGAGAEKSSAPAALTTATTTAPNGGGGRRPSSSSAAAENGLKKGPWTPLEDAILVDYVKKHSEGNWNSVQRITGLARCGKSCRLRWANHLRPNLRKGSFTPEEEMMILRLHSQIGNKWARMAAQLPGRTDNEIKNYWNTRIKRRQRAGLPLYPSEIRTKTGISRSSTIPSLQMTAYSLAFNKTGTLPSPASPLTLQPSSMLPSDATEHKAKYMALRPSPLMNATTSFSSPNIPSTQFANHTNFQFPYFQFPYLPVSIMSPTAVASMSPTTTLLSPTRASLSPLYHQQMQFGLGQLNTMQHQLGSPILPKIEAPSSSSFYRPSSSTDSNVMALQGSQLDGHSDFKDEGLMFYSAGEEKAGKSDYSMGDWCNSNGGDGAEEYEIQSDSFHFEIGEASGGGDSNSMHDSMHEDLSSMFDVPVETMSLNHDWYSSEDAKASDT